MQNLWLKPFRGLDRPLEHRFRGKMTRAAKGLLPRLLALGRMRRGVGQAFRAPQNIKT